MRECCFRGVPAICARRVEKMDALRAALMSMGIPDVDDMDDDLVQATWVSLDLPQPEDEPAQVAVATDPRPSSVAPEMQESLLGTTRDY